MSVASDLELAFTALVDYVSGRLAATTGQVTYDDAIEGLHAAADVLLTLGYMDSAMVLTRTATKLQDRICGFWEFVSTDRPQDCVDGEDLLTNADAGAWRGIVEGLNAPAFGFGDIGAGDVDASIADNLENRAGELAAGGLITAAIALAVAYALGLI